MNVKKITGSALVIVVVMAALAAQAQIFKTNNSDALNLGTSWVAGTAPGSGDVATWDATVSTAANCTNTLGGAVSWGGILVSNPAAPVNILTASTAISLGGSGITVTNTADLTVSPPVTTTADQAWTVGSGRTLTLGSSSRVITVS